MKHFGSAALFSALLAATPVSTANASGPDDLGIRAGLNLAGMSGGHPYFEEMDDGRIVGALAGIEFDFRLSSKFTFRTGMSYSMLGGDWKYSLTMGDTTGTMEHWIRLNYLEIPLLFEFEPNKTGQWRPFVFVGPAMAIKLGSESELTTKMVSQGETIYHESRYYSRISNVESIQYLALFGAGVKFDWGKRTVAIEGRYTLGLHKSFEGVGFINGLNLDEDEFVMLDIHDGGGADLKHSAISVSVALFFPL